LVLVNLLDSIIVFLLLQAQFPQPLAQTLAFVLNFITGFGLQVRIFRQVLPPFWFSIFRN